MLWTLCVVCGIGGMLIVRRIRTQVAARKSLLMPYNKSHADIDRLLPAEALERILSLCDPLTLLSMGVVSKYWNYNLERIRDQTLKSLEVHIIDLIGKIRLKTSDTIDTSRFKIFNGKDHNKAHTVNDQLHALSLGKNLIETDLRSARALIYAMQSKKAAQNICTKGYLLKFHAEMYKRHSEQFTFKDQDGEFCSVSKSQVSPNFIKQWKTGKPCEIVCELSDVNSKDTVHIRHLKRIRVIEQQTKFKGLTLDANLFKAIFMLLLPCVLNDVTINVPSATKQLLSNIVSVFAILFIGFMIAFTPIENAKHFRFQLNVQKFHNVIGGVCSLAWLLIASSMRDWSFNFGRYAWTVTIGKAYTNFMLQLFRSRERRKHLPFMATSAGLLSAAVDWQTIFGSSFGTLVQSFKYNVIFHMKFGIGLALFFAMVACFESNSIKLENFVPRRDLVMTHLFDIFIALYITLYNPLNI